MKIKKGPFNIKTKWALVNVFFKSYAELRLALILPNKDRVTILA
jgi:hypothetical protein